jgi:hypothetical protein
VSGPRGDAEDVRTDGHAVDRQALLTALTTEHVARVQKSSALSESTSGASLHDDVPGVLANMGISDTSPWQQYFRLASVISIISRGRGSGRICAGQRAMAAPRARRGARPSRGPLSQRTMTTLVDKDLLQPSAETSNPIQMQTSHTR